MKYITSQKKYSNKKMAWLDWKYLLPNSVFCIVSPVYHQQNGTAVPENDAAVPVLSSNGNLWIVKRGNI
jgi:hypothetical protein